MKLSCLLVSHNKPDLVHEAIESVLNQDSNDWELLIMDSGPLLSELAKYENDKVKLYASGETEELKQKKAMAPWCYNEFFRRNLVTGELISYLCDDDILYPCAFSVFQRWATNNPKMLAMYASIDLAFKAPEKEVMIYSQRKALEIGGKGAYGMDCRVDYLQFCHRREVLEHFEDDEYWPEGRATERHADGVFMDKVGDICHIYPIPVKIGQNRRTPKSTYYPT